MPEAIYTDVCIIGAGPGGATTAMFLAQHGVESTLVDKARFPRDKVCGDALSGKVVEVIKKLDPTILDRLQLESHQVGSWGVTFVAPNLTSLRVPFKQGYDKSGTPPGFISKRVDFDHFLVKETAKYPQIRLIEDTPIKRFEKQDKGYICYGSEVEIHCKLVIVADGAQSQFAKNIAGIKKEPKHYCAGIRAYYKGVEDLDADNFIELHFLKELLPGYFWIFPLPDGMTNVGLGIRSDKVSQQKINLKKKLAEVIEQYPQLKERFTHAELVGDIKGFGLPLGSKKRSISGESYMLVGDAASLIDPFTGEGIGNAMMSGMFAADQVTACLQADDYSAAFMQQYDVHVYNRLWSELSLSKRMQQLVKVPWLFNFVVNKASRNETLQETISCMFEDLDIRDRLRKPSFYFDILFK